MAAHDPEDAPLASSIPAPTENAPPTVVESQDSNPGSGVRVLGLIVLAGLLAGGLSVLVGEAVMEFYRSELNPNMKPVPKVEDAGRVGIARVGSVTLTFAAAGGILGATLGLAGGLSRRSLPSGTRAALSGFVVGLVLGAVVAMVVASLYFKHVDPQSEELLIPLAAHVALWSVVGAVGGLACGKGLGGAGRWKVTLMGGIVGAVAGSVVSEIVGALLFPSARTQLPVPETAIARGMAQMIVASLLAIGVALAAVRSAGRGMEK